MSEYFAIPPILGLGGLLIAFVIYRIMTSHDPGDGVVKKIG
ncbi:MAG: K(+)-stimulated pyrophosphate-energized sodium pump, partial [Halieaceae bacterium]